MRGGKRKGAGRKSLFKEPTKGICITVPVSQIEPVKKLVKNYLNNMNTRIETSLKVSNRYYPIEIQVNFAERSINVECMDVDETLRKDTEWDEQQMDNEEFVLDWILERLGDKIVNNIKTHYID